MQHVSYVCRIMSFSSTYLYVSPFQLSGFTSDPRELCSCLYDLETNVCDSFSILSLKTNYTMKQYIQH